MAALIAWKNMVDDATISVVGAGAAIDPDFPVANLKMRGLADMAATLPGTETVAFDVLMPPAAGKVDATFSPALDVVFQLNSYVTAIAVQPDGKILVAGSFFAAGGANWNNLTRLNVDGTFDSTFDAGAGPNGIVHAVAVQPDGKIIIAGEFTSPRSRIARLNSDGSLDLTFNPGTGPNNTVRAISLLPDGRLIIGGLFTAVAGTSRSRIARLNANGSHDTTFTPGAGANGAVYAVLTDAGGGVLIGGAFSTVASTTRRGIARLNGDGVLVTGFNPTLSVGAYVTDIIEHSSGDYVICGEFTTVNGVARKRLAMLTSAGATVAGSDPDIGFPMAAVAEQLDGAIVVAGEGPGIGRYATNMVRDPHFNHTLSNDALALAVQPDGKILVGGWMRVVDGIYRPMLARLEVDSRAPVRIVAALGLHPDSQGLLTIEYAADGINFKRLAEWYVSAGAGNGRDHIAHVGEGVAWSHGTYRFALWRDGFDTPQAPFGLARLWIGDALVLPDGIDAGWQMGFRDSGSLDATDGQQWVQSPGVITRVMTIPLEGYRKTETAWGFKDDATAITQPMSLHALQMEAGTTGEVIAVARTSTPLWTHHSAVYGRIDSPWAIGHTAGPYWGGSLTVVEER